LQKELLTREEWLRLAAQGAELGLWYWNEQTQSLFWDRKTREMFGVNLEGDVTVETFYNALHPDDRARVRDVWRAELESGLPYELEYRARHADGSVRWINARGSGYYDKAGKPLYMIGVVFDITERKRSERERLALSGRLITAQEEERRRLAQEIHDDFCQRFALLTVNAHTLATMVEAADARALLEELTATFAKLGTDLQSLSHRLYARELAILGVVPSLASLCAGLTREYGLPIAFDHANVPADTAADSALCLFRIVQESLRNVIKHSSATRAEVSVRADEHAISLTVFDNGAGFNVIDDRWLGIGIQSMRERTRTLNGRFDIQSRPVIDGTRITVTIPLRSAPW